MSHLPKGFGPGDRAKNDSKRSRLFSYNEVAGNEKDLFKKGCRKHGRRDLHSEGIQPYTPPLQPLSTLEQDA